MLGVPADDMLDEIIAWYKIQEWAQEEKAADDKGMDLEEYQALLERQHGAPPSMP